MCGRFTLFHSTDAIAQAFNLTDIPELTPHYNIAPSQEVATIRQAEETRQLQPMRWGLIPAWSKDAKIGNRLINAKAETLAEKPSFRNAFKHRRCLIVADGFYEWQKEGTPKQPYHIRLKDKKLFAFAGLWEVWQSKSGETVTSCTIITTEANDLVQPIHARMPVILNPSVYDQWLDPTITQTASLQTLLVPYDSEKMEAIAVSRAVNNPKKNEALPTKWGKM